MNKYAHMQVRVFSNTLMCVCVCECARCRKCKTFRVLCFMSIAVNLQYAPAYFAKIVECVKKENLVDPFVIFLNNIVQEYLLIKEN